MTSAEVIQRLREVPNRKTVSRETGIRYDYLSKVATGHIRDPGASKIDALRLYFQREDRTQ